MSMFDSSLSYITDSDGNAIARPALIYASQPLDSETKFKVTAPDGTCVIGSHESCMVSESTSQLRGGLMSVTIGEQIYRVKYSGPDSQLERFSITSFDPIIGNWAVELEQEGLIQQAHASEDIEIKIKYRTEDASIVTFSSQ